MSLFGDLTGFINSGRAAKSVSDSNIAAEHGVLDATQGATTGIENQLGKAYTDVGQAGANVNGATTAANDTLQNHLASIQGNLAPSIASGAQGNTALQTYAASNPQFAFDPSKYVNSDAMKFDIDQGQQAITNNASASGLGASGNTLKALTQFGQSTAQHYYDNAFQQQQQLFQTNQNTTLQNLHELINSGNVGNSLNQAAEQTFGAPQAQNTINASTTNASLQQFLAQLGLQGQETAGGMSIAGAKTAGDFGVAAGTAHGAGILAQGNNLTAGATDFGSLLANLGVGG
jgi:hypothetical protein